MNAGLPRTLRADDVAQIPCVFKVTRNVVAITNEPREKDDLDELVEEMRNDGTGFREIWDESELLRETGHAIIRARSACGMTQQQLAEKTGIRQGDISKIESARANPSLKTLKRIADGMGLKVTIAFELKKQD